MKWLSYAVITSVMIICLILGGVLIPLLGDNIKNAEDDKIDALVIDINRDVTHRFISNTTALGNYMLMTVGGFEGLYNLWNRTGELNQDNFQFILDKPHEMSAFDMTRVLVSRHTRSVEEMNRLIDFFRLYYNRPNDTIRFFSPINGTPVFDNITDSYYALVTSPYNDLPGFRIGFPRTAAIVGEDVLRSVETFPPGVPVLTQLNERIDINGNVHHNMDLATHHNGWVITSAFSQVEFLDSLLHDIILTNKAVIEAYEPNKTTFYRSSNESVSRFFTESEIRLGEKSIIIRTTLNKNTENGNRTSAYLIVRIVAWIIVMAIIVILGIAVAINDMNNARHLMQQEIDSNKKIQAVAHSNNLKIHEIRNIINATNLITKAKSYEKLTESDYDIVKNSIDNLVDIVSRVLDFEKLLTGTYEAVSDVVNIVDLINNVLRRYQYVNITMSHNIIPEYIITDKLKMYELLQNGLNNSCRYTTDERVKVRVQVIDDYLLVEILNKADNESILGLLEGTTIDDIFIPFFVREDESMWYDVIDNLRKDDKIHEKVSPYFGIENLAMIYNFSKSEDYHGKDLNSRTTGLGLSISRLVSRVFNGECGIDVDDDNSIVRYWFAVKFKLPDGNITDV